MKATNAGELRKVRTDLGLTQHDLAAETGISASRISDYERGVHVPGFRNRLLIAQALKTTPRKLFGEWHEEVA